MAHNGSRLCDAVPKDNENLILTKNSIKMKNSSTDTFKHCIAKPMLCEVALQKKIDKNRDEIDKWLSGDYPLDLVYMRIRMLSAQNERLISQLKAV